MDCYYCDARAVQECARCGALYCDDHGDALCQRCLDPALALPSHRVYRGSLIALLIGTVFAVWLLVKPPATSDADSPISPAISGVVGGATPAATSTPPSTGEGVAPPPAAPPAGATATPTATASPTASPTPAAPLEHRVVAGDTLYTIAQRYLPPGKSLDQFVTEIQAANGITNPSSINAGQTLRIPR